MAVQDFLEALPLTPADAAVAQAVEEALSWAEASCPPGAMSRAMDEAPIPGSRVRATTKHGALTVDEMAEALPGGARIMDELSRRTWTLYYAAKAGNWDLARYMERESEKLLRAMGAVRPKYRVDLEAFSREYLGPIARAIEARDLARFEEAYRAAIRASDTYHDKYNKGFIRFRLPDHAPEWFDLEPR